VPHPGRPVSRGRLTLQDRDLIYASVPHIVIPAFAADSETVPVGSTFEILRVATV
jgi:hypothetical protein